MCLAFLSLRLIPILGITIPYSGRSMARPLSAAISATLSGVPQHTRGAHEMDLAQAPGLHGRRPRAGFRERLEHSAGRDALPPGVQVVHDELHHEVGRELLDEEVLEKETMPVEFELGDFGVLEVHPESERLVERDRTGVVLCW